MSGPGAGGGGPASSEEEPLGPLVEIADAAWLVGGALRDRLLNRATSDYDVVVIPRAGESVGDAAREFGRRARAFAFSLSDAFGAWRVVAHDRSWQVDLTALEGPSIEADLARRDLTVNAIAEPLGPGNGLLDPFGGVPDLRRRRLRAVSPGAFSDDPLRVMRVARLACELGFGADPETISLARGSASRLSEVAAERVLAELSRILSSDHALAGLDLMDAMGATEAVLPELAALRGVGQSRFHHLDVFEHTRAVLAALIELERDPVRVLGAPVPAGLGELLEEPLAGGLTRGAALRFGALLHDIAKPQTRDQSPEGRVTFRHHDTAGAEVATSVLARLRAGERLIEFVAALTRHHLRLGFLVHEMPLGPRAVYRYLSACDPVSVEVTLLSVADRLATRGDGSEPAIARHLELARDLLEAGLRWRLAPPRAPVKGDQLAQALGIRPGPRLGELLRELQEATYTGEVSSTEDAIAYARRRVQGADPADG